MSDGLQVDVRKVSKQGEEFLNVEFYSGAVGSFKSKTFEIPLENGKFMLNAICNDNLKETNDEQLGISLPSDFIPLAKDHLFLINANGDLKVDLGSKTNLLTDQIEPQSNADKPNIDRLIIRSKHTVEVLGEGAFNIVYFKAGHLKNNANLTCSDAEIIAEHKVSNHGSLMAEDVFKIKCIQGILDNEGVLCCGHKNNEYRSYFHYEGFGLRVGVNGKIYGLDEMKFVNYRDLEVFGEIVSGFELGYRCVSRSKIHVHKDAIILSKNRAYLTTGGIAKIEGTVGARVDFSLNAREKVINSETGRIGCKGYTTIKTAGGLENYNTIESGKHLGITSYNLANYNKILSRGDASITGYHHTYNAGDILANKKGDFDFGDVFTNDNQARVLAANNSLTAKRIINLGNLYAREIQFLEHVSKQDPEDLQSEATDYAKFCLQLLKGTTNPIAISQNDHIQWLIALLDTSGKNREQTVLFADNLTTDLIPEFIAKAQQLGSGITTGIDSVQALVSANNAIANHSGGLIGGLHSLKIQGETVCNSGIIVSKDDLSVNNIVHINNLMTGYIIAFGDNKINCQSTLINAGSIVSGIDTSINVKQWIENLTTGYIDAKDLELQTKRMENLGNIFGNTILANMQNIFKQYIDGKIAAVEALKLLSGEVINDGVITGCNNLYIDAQNIIHNTQNGKISVRNSLTLICADIVKNAGDIESCGDIVAKANQVMLDLTSSRLVARHTIDLLIKFSIENAGLLAGREINLITKECESYIKLFASSDVCADNLQINTDKAINEGNIDVLGKIDLAAKALFVNLASGHIKAQDAINLVADKIQNAGVIAGLRDITATVGSLFENSGQLTANEAIAILCADMVKNTGNIESFKAITIKAQQLLQQVVAGKIISGEDLQCVIDFAVENAGVMAGDNVSFDMRAANSWLKNLTATSKIAARGRLSATADNLANAGEIASGSKIDFTTQVLLENVQNGIISSKDAINIQTGKLVNSSVIDAMGKITITAQQALSNMAGGKISSRAAISIICAGIIDNCGKIRALGDLKLQAEKILQQIVAGEMISDQQLDLIAQAGIVNAGVLSGQNVVLITKNYDALIKNATGGSIVAERNIKFISIQTNNAGLIDARGNISLLEHVVFDNLATGTIQAGEALDILSIDGENIGSIVAKIAQLNFSGEFINQGKIYTEKELSIKASKTIKLLKQGKITAKDAISIISDLKIYSEADVLAYKTLLMLAPIVDHQSGKMESATGDVVIDALDWILAGKVAAGHDLVAKIRGQWDRKATAEFTADDTVKLHLDQGYDFDQKISAKNNLELRSKNGHNFGIYTDLLAFGDLMVDGGQVFNGNLYSFGRLHANRKLTIDCDYFHNQNGGAYGGKQLDLKARNAINNGKKLELNLDELTQLSQVQEYIAKRQNQANGTYLASGGDANLSAGSGGINNYFADIFIAKDGKVDTVGKLHNLSGTIKIGGNAKVKASWVDHELLYKVFCAEIREQVANSKYQKAKTAKNSKCRKLSRKPIFSIGGSAQFEVANGFNASGGDLNVRGNCNFVKGSFNGMEIEEYDRVTTNHTQTIVTKGKRRYICCGPRKNIISYRYYEVTNHNPLGVSTANLNVGENLYFNDPDAKHIISGGSIGGGIIGRATSAEFAQPSNKRFAVNKAYHAVNLAAYSGGERKVFTDLPQHQHYAAYPAASETATVMEALADIGVKGVDTNNPVQTVIMLLKNAENYQNSLKKNQQPLTVVDLANVTEPMLVDVVEMDSNNLQQINRQLIIPNQYKADVAVRAKAVELRVSDRLTINNDMEIDQFFDAKTGYFTVGPDGKLAIKGKAKIIAKRDLNVEGEIHAEDILLESLLGDISISSWVEHITIGHPENFDDILHRARVCAQKILIVRAKEGNVVMQTAETKSGIAGTYIISELADILCLPVEVVSQRVTHFCERKKSGWARDTHRLHQTSMHSSLGDINFGAGRNIVAAGSFLAGENVIRVAGNDVIDEAAVDLHEHEEHITTKSRSIVGSKKKTSQVSDIKSRTKGVIVKAQQTNKLEAKRQTHIWQPNYDAQHHDIIGYEVFIKQGKEQKWLNAAYSSSDLLWSSSRVLSLEKVTHLSGEIAGTILIKARKAEIEISHSQAINWLEQLIEKPDDLTFVQMCDKFVFNCDEHEGPGPALLALVAVAVTVATQGAASGWAAGMLGSSGAAAGATAAGTAAATASISQTMLAATLQGLCAKAATSVVGNMCEGDILGKAAKNLLKEDIFKSLAVQALSAGIMQHVGDKFNLSKDAASGAGNASMAANHAAKAVSKLQQFSQDALHNSIKAGVDAGLETAAYGGSFGDRLANNLKSAGLDAAISMRTRPIDQRHANGDISTAKQLGIHAALGVAKGFALHGHDGVLEGAGSAVIRAEGANYQCRQQEKLLAGIKLQEQQIIDRYDLAEPTNLTAKQKLFLRMKQELEDATDFSININKYIDMSNHLISSARINSDYEYQYIMPLREQQKVYDSSDIIDLERFEASVFRDPKALAEYEKYTAERGQYRFWENNDFSVGEAPANRYRDASKIISFMFPAAYGSENSDTPQQSSKSKYYFGQRHGETYISIMQDEYDMSLATVNTLGNMVFNPRTQGVLQTAWGVTQVTASVVGGVTSLETGIGPIIAASYAVVGVDNMFSGASSVISGITQPTLLFQAAKGVGLSDNAASWAELAINLSPSMPGVAKEVGGLANKGLTKLYDLRNRCSQSKALTISANSTPAEIFYGYGDLSARQSRYLLELSAPGAKITLHKSDINVADLAALTAKTGDEFYMFTLGGRRIVGRGYAEGFEFNERFANKLFQQGWRLSSHTHPGTADRILMSSGNDRNTLKFLKQERSLIANSANRIRIFTKDGMEKDLTFFRDKNIFIPKFD